MNMAKEEKKKLNKSIENLTLASAFEMIYEESCESKLSPEFFDMCNDAINFVRKELNVTHFQSIMLAILANSDESKSLKDMASYTKCSPIRFRIHNFVQWSMTRCSLE